MPRRGECFICFERKPRFPFDSCSCKMYVCGECIEKWNNRTFPYLQCPVCREVYDVHYMLEDMIIIHEPEGPRFRIRLNQLLLCVAFLFILFLMAQNLKKPAATMVDNDE